MSRVWFVTGCSRGLGRALVEVALEAGDRVAATARNPERLHDLLDGYGDAVLPLRLDVTDYDATARVVCQAVEAFGRLDAVVNSAGYGDLGSFEDTTIDSFRTQIETNFYGVVNVSKAVVPVLREQGSGHIFQVASLSARLSGPGMTAYQAAKWAVAGFSIGLAREIAPFGVKLTVLEPGGMRTDWAGSSMTIQQPSKPYQPTIGPLAKLIRATSGHEATDPRRVAHLVRDLAGRDDAPVRLLLGTDAVPMAQQTAQELAAGDEAWRDVSLSVSDGTPPTADAPTPRRNTASARGLPTTRLDGARTLMGRYVERGDVPGLVTLVSRHGETHVDAFGTKRTDGGGPVERDTIFRITSMTKPITAVAAMILVDEGLLGLDAPVDDLLPELANRRVLKRPDGPLDDTVAAVRPITLRDLLTLRMGFGLSSDSSPINKAATDLDFGPGRLEPQEMPEPDEWIRRVGALPLLQHPGEVWRYTTGLDVVSVLVARATGQPFETFLRERLFDPLGMKDTGFYVPTDKLDRFITAYANTLDESGELMVEDEPSGQWAAAPAFPAGSAGLVSTVDDYFALAAMLLAGGRYGDKQILSRPSVEQMTTDHLTDQQKPVFDFFPDGFADHGWGLGIGVTHRPGVETAAAYGWAGGLGTAWLNDPAEDLIVIVLSQRQLSAPHLPAYAQDFWASVYRSIDVLDPASGDIVGAPAGGHGG